MILRRTRSALALTVAAAGLTGCIDMDVQTALKKDGAGTMSMKIGFTDGFVEILHKMQEIDPDQDVLESAKEFYFDEPSDEDKAAMKAAGLELLEFEGERSEKKIFSRFKVAFDHLDSLAEMDRIRPEDSDPGDGPGQSMTLVKNDDGTYTLSMDSPDDDGDDELSDTEIDDLLEDEVQEASEDAEEDPEEAMKKAAAAMELMGSMMAEMANLKIAIGMEVPGEIVSFSPSQFAKQDGQKVTWTIDMAAAMGGAMGDDMDGFSVTFKMPEGETFPDAALTKTASAESTETPETK